MNKDLKKLNIGWDPSCLGLRPLRVELDSYLKDELNIYSGSSSQIFKLLQNSNLDIAPEPSIQLLYNTEMCIPAGVVADDYSMNMYLGLNIDSLSFMEKVKDRISFLRVICQNLNIEQVSEFKSTASNILDATDSLSPIKMNSFPTLKISSQASCSSVVLAKLFYRLMFGKMAYDSLVSGYSSSSSSDDMVLLSGTEAILRRKEFIRIIDLGHFWRTLTDLPFVSMVWQQNPGYTLPVGWKKKILEVCELCQSKMKIDPGRYMQDFVGEGRTDLSVEFSNYWKGIRYKFEALDIKGLMLFLALAKAFIKVNIDEVAITKMLVLKDHAQVSSDVYN